MRKHRGHGGHRTRAAALIELALHLVRQRSLLKHDGNAILELRERSDKNIDQDVVRPAFCETELDAIPIESGAGRFDLFDKIEKRRAAGDELIELDVAHRLAAHSEKRFRRDIGVGDRSIKPHREDRMGQCVQNFAGVDPQ